MASKITVGEIITWANEQIMADVRLALAIVEDQAAVEGQKAEAKFAEWRVLPGNDGEPY